MSSKQTKKDPTFERLPTIEKGDYSKYKSQPATLGNKYKKKVRSQKYKNSMRQENRANKQDSENRSNASLLEFDRELANQTKYQPKEKKYRKSILTSRSPGSTQTGGKRRKPRKTKKHRKKKSL